MKKKSLSRLAATAAVLALTLSTPAIAGNAPDLDADGVPNVVDPDIDNDGIPNALDKNVDGGICRSGPRSGQYIGDHLDNDNPAELDIDDDAQDDNALGELDIDADGNRDDSPLEDDIDGDGRNDDSPAEMDEDGDGQNDDSDIEDDVDGDGFDDDDYTETDIDGDGRDDDSDDDIDGDNRFNGDVAETDTDADGRSDDDSMETNDDGDSRGDREDDDDDNDGQTDEDDADHHHEDDEQEVQVELARQAAAPDDSRSRVKIQQMATGKIEFEIDARDIPAGAYDVVIDGVARGILNVLQDGDDTEGEQEWETGANQDENELPLTFEVIGRSVSLQQNGVVYFSGTVPVPPPPGGTGGTPVVPSTGDLQAGPAAPAGVHGKVKIEFGSSGASELEVEIEDLSDGAYNLLIGDAERGTITVSDGHGRLRFDTSPDEAGELPLDFAAAGLPISIVQDAAIFFTGTVPAAPPAVGDGDDTNDDSGDGSTIVTGMTPAAGAPAGASGEIQIHFGIAGATALEVELEDVADNDYQLLIDGSPRGTITVNAGRGSLRFEITPDDAGELPLDFSAAGMSVAVRQGDSVIFNGTVPTAPGA